MIPGDRRYNENHSAGFPTFGLVTRSSVSMPLEFAGIVAVPFLAADSMLNAKPPSRRSPPSDRCAPVHLRQDSPMKLSAN